MKKPKYLEELVAFVFLCLGSFFLLFGVLSYVEMIHPTTSSQIQDAKTMGFIFGGIGLAFLIACGVLTKISRLKWKKHTTLLKEGTQCSGIVEEVILQNFTRFGNQSPYLIVYTFSSQGRQISRKSGYIWEKPAYKAGDEITVFTNDKGDSTVAVK